MSRCAMTLPIVARRSPAITTPRGWVTATIVVPCRTSPTTETAAAPRRPGSRSGACAARKSVKEEDPGVRNVDGRQPERQESPMHDPFSVSGERWAASGERWVAGNERALMALLLAALLHVRAHELLGVLLQHVVDLVQERVHVITELVVPLLDRVGCRVLGGRGIDLVVLAVGALLAATGVLHRHPYSRLAAVAVKMNPTPRHRQPRASAPPAVPIRRRGRRPARLRRCTGRSGGRHGPWCRAAARGSAPAAASPDPHRRSHCPRRRRRPRRRTSPSIGRGSRPGCPRAALPSPARRPPR